MNLLQEKMKKGRIMTVQICQKMRGMGDVAAKRKRIRPFRILAVLMGAGTLAMRHGGAGAAQEEAEDGEPSAQLLDGSTARRLCGAACRLDVDQALDLLFEQRRAARAGQEEAAIRRMTRTYLEGCRA